MKWLASLYLVLLALPAAAHAQASWTDVPKNEIALLADDDLSRHAGDPAYLDGLAVGQIRFTEAGFNWHLLRIVNSAKAAGPLWAVPHDDENAAFESAIAAVKAYGGVVVTVNSGPGSSRTQGGLGHCGGRSAAVGQCDPNRNFSTATPLYTQAFLNQLPAGQPIIAVHTNSPGYGHGQGDITILDVRAAAMGITQPRADGHFGKPGVDALANYDTYAIIPYLPPKTTDADISCRKSLVEAGVHVWHERVDRSDGSFSNYVVKNVPGTRYVNMESRRELDLMVATNRHARMISAYLNGCSGSGN